MVQIIEPLIKYIERDNYAGWDPFDGLNSPLISHFKLLNKKIPRLVLIQLLKRSLINLRPILGIRKGHNVKALSLILSSYIMLQENASKIMMLTNRILSHRSEGYEQYCWGYNFPWQARAFYVERWKPNIIVSTFTAQALLDLFENTGDEQYLDIVKSTAEFIFKSLTLLENDNELCFGYIPGEPSRVHNANLMGAKLFARLFSITGMDDYREKSINSANYTINRQNPDGSWHYGEMLHHKWIDNFHTGFNLVALNEIQDFIGMNFGRCIDRGYRYHLENHFLKDLTPKYYHNKLYPIDIHNFAQGIITFTTFADYEKAQTLLKNVVEIMWDNKNQYFYYQNTKYYKNRINYLRWGNAWMLYALAVYKSHGK